MCYQYEEGPTARQMTAAMVAGGALGIGTGVYLARKPITAGVATTVSLSGLWGTWFGFAAGNMADLTENDLMTATLLTGNAAIGAGAILAPRWNPSRSRARLVSLGGLVGGVAGAGVDLLVQPENEDVAIGIPLAGSIAGLFVASHLTRDYDNAGAQGSSGGEALLNWDDGFRIGVVEPVPVLRRDERGARPRLEPAVSFTLFQARFN